MAESGLPLPGSAASAGIAAGSVFGSLAGCWGEDPASPYPTAGVAAPVVLLRLPNPAVATRPPPQQVWRW